MRILYVTTTFPVYSETFIQREARALVAAGADLRIVSLHRGEAVWEGIPVERFSKFSLFRLLYLLPFYAATRPARLIEAARELNRHCPPSWLNFWENLLGFGAALVLAGSVRRDRIDWTHCVWAGGPAAFGLALNALLGNPFSTGAHAYDVFAGGGDWLLAFKARKAAFIHCSTEAAASRMRRFASSEKVVLIRRGLYAMPRCKPLRTNRSTIRLLCVARLVEKKGLFLQLEIYRALRDAGVRFEARIAGDGPLAARLRERIENLGLASCVRLLGRIEQAAVMEEMGWADALLHTGIVAPGGDRDGLPNAVAEAMACGVVVFASPMAGVCEAVVDGKTGLVLDPARPGQWVAPLARLGGDDGYWENRRAAARAWVELHFDAANNAARLEDRMRAQLDQRGVFQSVAW